MNLKLLPDTCGLEGHLGTWLTHPLWWEALGFLRTTTQTLSASRVQDCGPLIQRQVIIFCLKVTFLNYRWNPTKLLKNHSQIDIRECWEGQLCFLDHNCMSEDRWALSYKVHTTALWPGKPRLALAQEKPRCKSTLGPSGNAHGSSVLVTKHYKQL